MLISPFYFSESIPRTSQEQKPHNFSRRFKRATKLSPVDYIQRVKMEAAKRSLEAGRKNINEVMYMVGYTDVKAFRSIFKKVAGLTPQEYRIKFSQS